MKDNFSNVKVQFKFFFLYILISNLYCKDIYKENINDSIKEKQIVQEDIKIITSILEPGKVYNLNLYKLTEINIRFLKDYGDNLLVQLYPLECKIYLTDSAGKTNNIFIKRFISLYVKKINYFKTFEIIFNESTFIKRKSSI